MDSYTPWRISVFQRPNLQLQGEKRRLELNRTQFESRENKRYSVPELAVSGQKCGTQRQFFVFAANGNEGIRASFVFSYQNLHHAGLIMGS